MKLSIVFKDSKGNTRVGTLSQSEITLAKLTQLCKDQFPEATPEEIRVIATQS